MAQEPEVNDGYNEAAELLRPRVVWVRPILDQDGIPHDFQAAPPSEFRVFGHRD